MTGSAWAAAASSISRSRCGRRGSFYNDPQWGEMEDWESVLAPHYAMAEQMLGVATVPFDDPADSALIKVAEEMERPHGKVNTAVFYGEPGVTVADPVFRWRRAAPAGLHRCGKCVFGCRYNAKNTLPRNYLLSGRAARRADSA